MAKTARKKLKANATNSDTGKGSVAIKSNISSVQESADENKAKKRKHEKNMKTNCAKKDSTDLQGNKTLDKQSAQRNEDASSFAEDQKAEKSYASQDDIRCEDALELSLQSRKTSSPSSQNSKKKKKKAKLEANPVTEMEVDSSTVDSVSKVKPAEKSACLSSDAGITSKSSANKQSACSKNKTKVCKQPKNDNDQDNVSEAKPTQQTDSTAKYHALEYLRRWKHDRSQWSFQKVRQVWLLQNMYDETKVSGEDFDIMIEYLEDLAGKARQATVDQAEKMMREAEDDESSQSAVSDDRLDRIRQVLQILS